MNPYLYLLLIMVGMAINAAIVLHWQRRERRDERERER